MPSYITIILLSILLIVSEFAHAEEPISNPVASQSLNFDNFMSEWQKRIFDSLQYIRSHPSITERDRFLIVEAGEQKYVQCLFHDNDHRVYCEASSGFYGRPNALQLSAKLLSVIANEGFSTDVRSGNFSFDTEVLNNKTLQDVADSMLKILYEAYNADRIPKFCTPYTPDEYYVVSSDQLLAPQHTETMQVDPELFYSQKCAPITQRIDTVAGYVILYRRAMPSLWWHDIKLMETKGLQLFGTAQTETEKPSIVIFTSSCQQKSCVTSDLYFIDMETLQSATNIYYLPIQITAASPAKDTLSQELTVNVFANRFFVFSGTSTHETVANDSTYIYDRKNRIVIKKNWNLTR